MSDDFMSKLFAEDNSDAPKENGFLATAVSYYDMYNGFVTAGFTPDQALAILSNMVSVIVANSVGGNN